MDIESNKEYIAARSNFIVADVNLKDNPNSKRFINEYNSTLKIVQNIIQTSKED